MDLLTSEDILLDLTQPLYLNFTHEAIVNRFEKRYEAHDKITGDVYVCDNPPVDASTDGWESIIIDNNFINNLFAKICLQYVYKFIWSPAFRAISKICVKENSYFILNIYPPLFPFQL